MSIKKVLIVDDEMILNELIKERLELYGYETVSAYDGDEAIQCAQTENPDLILLDMTLPPAGGEAVYEQLKQADNTRNIPVLIITAEVPKRLKEFFISKGIPDDDVFIKPLDFKALNNKLSLLK
jgi:two-component system response regulator VicR